MELSKEDKKYYLNYNIIGETEISDTIVSFLENNEIFYKNINSGKKAASFKDVLRDKKYIFISHEYLDNKRKGWIAKYIEERNVLLSVFYVLKKIDSDNNFEWVERFRLVFSGTDYTYISKSPLLPSKYARVGIIKTYDFASDLCGQFVHKEFDTFFGINVASYSGREARKFTNGGFYSIYLHYNFVHGCDLCALASSISYNSPNLGLGIEKKCMAWINMEEKPLPEDITMLIEDSAKKSYDRGIYSFDSFVDGFYFAYIQKDKDEYIYRIFHTYICGMPNKTSGRLPIEYTEIERIRMFDGNLYDINDFFIPVLCYDKEGIENSPFKYSIKYVEKSIEKNKDILNNYKTWGCLSSICDSSTSIALCMAFCPAYEKIVNLFKRNGEEDERYKAMLHIVDYGENFISELSNFIIPLNQNCEQVNKILGISKAAMDVFVKGTYNLSVLKTLKEIFVSEEQYLMAMDKETAKQLFDSINKYQLYKSNFDNWMSILIKLYGPYNCVEYIEFTGKEYAASGFIKEYINYIRKIELIKEASDLSLPWKVKRKDLEKTENAIRDVYRLANDKKYYQEALECFKSNEKCWQKYEYTGDKFIVTYPKSPTDLAEEGLKLNHCAKEFINAVAENKTIILFIRRKDAPEKPFFTLEIRNSAARQCHGVNNCNVYECNGVAEFLEEFCRAKNIDVDDSVHELFGALNA